jgi:D-3-phosphoglycerate dehydrogenase
VLLEGIHRSAVDALAQDGYTSVSTHPGALAGDALLEAIADAHFIGIRSRTRLTESVLEQAPRLVAIGAFCIGTNQIDLAAAARRGVPVFNAPFSNTRSVAELVLAEIVMLLRGIPLKNALLHRGGWSKSAAGSYEARGKVLGIVGYGHIGPQIGVLAAADVVTLHVPETPATRMMIGAEQLARMKSGAHLVNASRGTVVDLDALAAALGADQ